MNRILIFAAKKVVSSFEKNQAYWVILFNQELQKVYSNTLNSNLFDNSMVYLAKERKKTTYNIDGFNNLSICTPIQKINGEIIGYVAIAGQEKQIENMIISTELLASLIYEKYKLYTLMSVIKTKKYSHEIDLVNLTDKELDIVKLISDGKTDSYIAKRLNISKSTVRAHINNIFRKLEITNRVHLMIYYYNSRAQNIIKMF